MKRVLVFDPYSWTPHFETSLEIMQNHLSEGDHVTYLGCYASLPACDMNPTHKLAVCLFCISKRRKGLRLLNKEVKNNNFVNLDRNDRQRLRKLRVDFRDIDDLKQYYIGNFDIGYSVASSFLFHTRDPYLDMSLRRNRVYASRWMISAFKVYCSLKSYLETGQFDRVYTFNGRFAPFRGVLRACQEYNIECVLHERGSSIYKYALYRNALPHDLNKGEIDIIKAWEDSTDENKERVAADFYHGRAAGKDDSWHSFVKKQRENMLPEKWDAKKTNIVLFNSSEDEFGAIGDEWLNPLYNSQSEGISKIVHSLERFQDKYHIYLRMHPNLAGVVNKSLTDIYKIKAPNFTIIPSESEISTYALIRAADKVVTFGSTVGIEAAFWGKPSILAGISYYRNLGSVYTPVSHQELIEMLLSDLQPKNKEGALKYGYYQNTFGINYKHYVPENLKKGKFKGKELTSFIELLYISLFIKAS
jgi:hypothetical protein